MLDPTGRTDIRHSFNIIVNHMYSVTVIATPSTNEWDDRELEYTAVCGHGVGEFVIEKRLSMPAWADPYGVSIALARQLVKHAPAGTLAPIGRNPKNDPLHALLTLKGDWNGWGCWQTFPTFREYYKTRLTDLKTQGIIGRKQDLEQADLWLNYSN